MELRKAELQEVEPYAATRDDPTRFLHALRQLRAEAGLEPVELAARAHYPCDMIRAAEAGPSLPSLPVLSAYVRGCGGTPAEWEERWRSLTRSPASPLLPVRSAGESDAATAGARIGAVTPAADGHDPSFIMAALGRVADGIAAESSLSAPGAGVATAEADVTISDAVPVDAAAFATPSWAGSGTTGAALSPDAAPGTAPTREPDSWHATVPAPATTPEASTAPPPPAPAARASATPPLPASVATAARASGARSQPPRAMLAALIAVAACLLVLLAIFA